MEKTQNYNLYKPESSEQFNIGTFNANSDLIDTKLKDLDDKASIIDRNIEVAENGQYTIGSDDKKLKAIYADEVHISQNTLYVGGVPVLGTSDETITVKADPDQSIMIKTTGEGLSQITSESGITISSTGLNSIINISSKGTNSAVNIAADKNISVSAPNVAITGTATIENLNVTGTTTTVNSDNLSVKDNVIELNAGEAGNGVTKGTAGIKVNRG